MMFGSDSEPRFSRLCVNYIARGYCYKGDQCQFLHSRGELIESPVKRPENQILPAGESFIVQVTQVDPSSSGSFHVIALSKSLPNRTGAGKPEKNPDLENLNRAMNRFYAVNYIPKAETFHPDSVMAFRGHHRWERVLLKYKVGAEEWRVFHLDFGVTSIAKESDLFRLHRRFAFIPAQAVRCKLASDDTFDPDKFFSLVTVTMNCVVTAADSKGRSDDGIPVFMKLNGVPIDSLL